MDLEGLHIYKQVQKGETSSYTLSLLMNLGCLQDQKMVNEYKQCC